ncbi:MAG: hypothetical protein K1Y36_18605 [Blastocatellia bacterium]|nr:hypothetical protein [Blastocatellia bacterium]
MFLVNVLISLPVLLSGLYLVGLGVVAFAAPHRAKLFLSGFAISAFAHYFELCVRFVIGGALVWYAPHMKFPSLFMVFGWVLVVTTIGLCAIPWRWHHRFAAWSVPLATRNMALFGLGSLTGGIFLLLSVVLGPGIAP